MERHDNIIYIAVALSIIIGLINLFLNHKNKQAMATKEDFQNLKSDMSADVGNVRGDVTGLKQKIADLEAKVNDVLANAGMSAAEEQEIFDGFKGVKEDISALAGDTPEDSKPEEPTTPPLQ